MPSIIDNRFAEFITVGTTIIAPILCWRCRGVVLLETLRTKPYRDDRVTRTLFHQQRRASHSAFSARNIRNSATISARS